MIIKIKNINPYGKYFLATEADDDDGTEEEATPKKRNVKVVSAGPDKRRKDFTKLPDDDTADDGEETLGRNNFTVNSGPGQFLVFVDGDSCELDREVAAVVQLKELLLISPGAIYLIKFEFAPIGGGITDLISEFVGGGGEAGLVGDSDSERNICSVRHGRDSSGELGSGAVHRQVVPVVVEGG